MNLERSRIGIGPWRNGTAYPRSGGRVDNIGKWSGRYAKRKAWNKKSRAPSDVQAGCPRASFRDAPCGGRASTGAPFLNPVIWNLHRKNRGSLPLWRGPRSPGKNNWHPSRPQRLPPYSFATMQQTHEKFTLQSPVKRSQERARWKKRSHANERTTYEPLD